MIVFQGSNAHLSDNEVSEVDSVFKLTLTFFVKFATDATHVFYSPGRREGATGALHQRCRHCVLEDEFSMFDIFNISGLGESVMLMQMEGNPFLARFADKVVNLHQFREN